MTTYTGEVENGEVTVKIPTDNIESGEYKANINYLRNDKYTRATEQCKVTVHPLLEVIDNCTDNTKWGYTRGATEVTVTDDGVSIPQSTWGSDYWKIPVSLDGISKLSFKAKSSKTMGNFTLGLISLIKTESNQNFLPIIHWTNENQYFEGVIGTTNTWSTIGNRRGYPFMNTNEYIDISIQIKNRNVELQYGDISHRWTIPKFNEDDIVNGYAWLGINNPVGTEMIVKDITLKTSELLDETGINHLMDYYTSTLQ